MKNIVLIIPSHFELSTPFVENLKKCGFNVEFCYQTDIPFKYRSFKDRFVNFIQKTILSNKAFKVILRKKYVHMDIEQFLKSVKNEVDFVMIIRPDFLLDQTIQMLKKKSKYIVAYQWDGISRFPDVENLIPYFDRFWVFDVDDEKKYGKTYPNISMTTNFYFDCYEPKKEAVQSVFFIGSFIENRISKIFSIADHINSINYPSEITIYFHEKNIPELYPNPNIKYTTEKKNFADMVAKVLEHNVLLDFANDIHNGLSFRTFEAIGYKKKLITNNSLVKSYDFYNSNNIFVIEGENYEGLEDFIRGSYQTISPNIVEKYSFSNWINYILNIDPYQKIETKS